MSSENFIVGRIAFGNSAFPLMRTSDPMPSPHISVFNAISRGDPTRTTTIRKKFSQDLTKRFIKLKGLINESIIKNDALALRKNIVLMAAAGYKQFDFPRDQQKITAFMKWLREQENEGILELIEGQDIDDAIEDAWTNKYITSAYQKGIIRGRNELRNAGYEIVPVDEFPGGVQGIFNTPFHLDRVGVAYTRTFTGLDGITKSMDRQISQTLAQGLAEGRNPIDIARMINNRVDKIGITRAKTLARTEVIRAHHSATMQEYRNAEIPGVKVLAEFTATGDRRVCPTCAGLQGKTFTLKQAEGMIPVHPNCRCVFLPVDVTDLSVAQQRKLLAEGKIAQDKIAAAEKSIKAGPKRGPKSRQVKPAPSPTDFSKRLDKKLGNRLNDDVPGWNDGYKNWIGKIDGTPYAKAMDNNQYLKKISIGKVRNERAAGFYDPQSKTLVATIDRKNMFNRYSRTALGAQTENVLMHEGGHVFDRIHNVSYEGRRGLPQLSKALTNAWRKQGNKLGLKGDDLRDFVEFEDTRIVDMKWEWDDVPKNKVLLTNYSILTKSEMFAEAVAAYSQGPKSAVYKRLEKNFPDLHREIKKSVFGQ